MNLLFATRSDRTPVSFLPCNQTRALGALFLFWLPATLGAACRSSSSGTPGTTDGGLSDVLTTRDVPVVQRCMPAETVGCVDQQITGLDLFDTVSPALITEEGTTANEFSTHIDGTGGGREPTQSYVYGRFTANGLEKVEISDEDAFASVDWDIAFRRFVIRVNSGVGGPSCVQVARTAPGTTFDGLTSIPSTLTFRSEEYFTRTCEIVPDGSGLGSPATALSSYWTYPGCVSTTGNVYIVHLRNGRRVKLQVLSYYAPPIQEQCNERMTLPANSMSANFRVRWAFID